MTIPIPVPEHDAASPDQPVYLYIAEALPPYPLLKVGQSRDPRARQGTGLILPEAPGRSRLLALIQVPDSRTAMREACDLHKTMGRDHPHFCLPQPCHYHVAALEVICEFLDAIALRHGRDG